MPNYFELNLFTLSLSLFTLGDRHCMCVIQHFNENPFQFIQFSKFEKHIASIWGVSAVAIRAKCIFPFRISQIDKFPRVEFNFEPNTHTHTHGFYIISQLISVRIWHLHTKSLFEMKATNKCK